MNGSLLLVKAVSAFLLPPLNLVVLCAAGVLLRRRWQRFGTALALASLAMLLLLSTNAGARLLLRPLEDSIPALSQADAARAQAIVVLGGGRSSNAPEYGGQDVPRPSVLARMRYAARLQRQTGLPILASGGSPGGVGDSEAALMVRVLQEDFRASVRWVEDSSVNTAQNAAFSAAMLRTAGVSQVLLVTDALHMPRSKRTFEQSGLTVIAAPTNYLGRGELLAIDFLPNAGALHNSHYAMHEWVGLLWYALAYRGKLAAPQPL